jgi:hypothetical protein
VEGLDIDKDQSKTENDKADIQDFLQVANLSF